MFGGSPGDPDGGIIHSLIKKFIVRVGFNSVRGTIVTGYLHRNYAVERETNGVARLLPRVADKHTYPLIRTQ